MPRANPAGYYALLQSEVIRNPHGLSPSLHRCLSAYYTSLQSNAGLRPFYRYNWMRRTEPMMKRLQSLPPREPPWRVLDAGCGVGTESIFWASLRTDVTVVGVDLSEDRLAVAKARKRNHERLLSRCLDLNFRNADVFSTLQSEDFDLIWTMEAISHIHPAEGFLTAAFESIEPGGSLVISDSHLLNPAMAWRVFRMRLRGINIHAHRVAPGGESIPYAQERLFSANRLADMLRRAGFSAVRTQLSVFFPPQLARIPWLFPVGPWLDTVLNRTPMLRHIGGIYTLVAER